MKKTFHIKKSFQKCLFLLIGLILVSSSFAQAKDGLFQNNLVKMDISKTSKGDVKVILYTQKPYGEPVVVNKKSDNKYVILLPETANSITVQPALKTSSDIIQNVEVKTQKYNPELGQKGYTKITFSTSKSVNITPQAQTLKAPAKTQTTAPTKVVAKAPEKVAVKTTTKATAKALTAPRPKTKPMPSNNYSQKTTTPIKKATATPANVQPAPKATPAPVKKIETETTLSPSKAVEKTKAILSETDASLQNRHNASEELPSDEASESQTTAPETQTAPAPVEEKIQAPIAKKPHSAGILSKVKHILVKGKNLIMNNLYIVLAAVLAPLLIILILMLIMVKKEALKQEQQEAFDAQNENDYLEENPSNNEDYTEEGGEDLNWREKYKAHTESSPTAESQPENNFQNDTEDDSLPKLISDSDDSYYSDLDDSEQVAIEEADFSGYEDADFEMESEEKIAEPQEIELAGDTEEYEDEFENETDEPAESEEDEILNELASINALDELEGIVADQASYEADVDDIFSGEEETSDELKEDFPYEAFEPAEAQFEEIEASEPAFEEHSFEDIEEVVEESEEDKLVQSQVVINSEISFYLIDFEGSNALVGQLGEEVFILKRFEEAVRGSLQARLNEKKGTTSTYMVRADGYKALIEVSSDDMKLLIEL